MSSWGIPTPPVTQPTILMQQRLGILEAAQDAQTARIAILESHESRTLWGWLVYLLRRPLW